jgi:hypothetical protein
MRGVAFAFKHAGFARVDVTDRAPSPREIPVGVAIVLPDVPVGLVHALCAAPHIAFDGTTATFAASEHVEKILYVTGAAASLRGELVGVECQIVAVSVKSHSMAEEWTHLRDVSPYVSERVS